MALGLLVALQGRGERAECRGDRAVRDDACDRQLAGDGRQELVEGWPPDRQRGRRTQTSAQTSKAVDQTACNGTLGKSASSARPLSIRDIAANARSDETLPGSPAGCTIFEPAPKAHVPSILARVHDVVVVYLRLIVQHVPRRLSAGCEPCQHILNQLYVVLRIAQPSRRRAAVTSPC